MALVKRPHWPAPTKGSWLSDLFDEERFFVDKLFDYPLHPFRRSPAVNVRETEKSYEIELAAPGLVKKDFDIEIENNVMTISAEKKEEREEKEENYTRREFGYTSFSRSFNLPLNTNEEDVKARYEDGILKLSIAKKEPEEKSKRKAVEIK